MIGADLTNASFGFTNLTLADLTSANLTNSNFSHATLTGAIFNNAEVRDASFSDAVDNGFTWGQLRSTASYKTKNLSGIKLSYNYLSNWDFHEQNLTNADFSGAVLSSVVFIDANIQGASFYNTTSLGFTQAQLQSTASFQAKDLSGINLGFTNDLSGWDFHDQNLTNAIFVDSNLTARFSITPKYVEQILTLLLP